jgi:transposase-like protein
MSKTAYTFELAAKFCAAVAEGGSLRAVCAKTGMPSKATVFRWLREHPEFVTLYEQATDDRADAHVEEIIEIADKCKADKDAVAKAKLQIYARIEAVQKMKPRKYGSKVQLTGDGGGAIDMNWQIDFVKPRDEG